MQVQRPGNYFRYLTSDRDARDPGSPFIIRNRALGEADPWEQQALLYFEKRLAKGEKIETLEVSEIISEPAGKMFRYAKAIPMGQPCMACHGPVSGLSDAVKAQLATEYPFDRAVDFQLGQIRGAVSVKKSL